MSHGVGRRRQSAQSGECHSFLAISNKEGESRLTRKAQVKSFASSQMTRQSQLFIPAGSRQLGYATSYKPPLARINAALVLVNNKSSEDSNGQIEVEIMLTGSDKMLVDSTATASSKVIERDNRHKQEAMHETRNIKRQWERSREHLLIVSVIRKRRFD
ncbi:hypothetical protein BDN70DRAFT_444340 [Pholiota conissans]|uniref:Uncharacterized protein n=1 Tax=Pholiota conissans TaxID=109636 RepID=A0A9P6CVY7_9AGAR|nr:hypothetical protein BDN70DRAFT_444340 [Pholiota conissans]